MSPTINLLNILFWNARGTRNKFIELVDNVTTEEIDIIGVIETFLEDNTFLPSVNQYDIVRADKSNHSGGLLFLIKSTLNYTTPQLICW